MVVTVTAMVTMVTVTIMGRAGPALLGGAVARDWGPRCKSP
ncbi:hypothetical protein PR003_g19558 [Phytophthora rubi]|uniref:Uncharacterized protein n=1 Tax=Phytophthora rubi TaxID=129364 RepID=A0A6A3IR05_9STRA|nr:hypothetical protein PR002_g22921 [Phytophthora rubi]KAE9313210.1 hypothetical protein PR003_g19558 [Phytophthora rubi]